MQTHVIALAGLPNVGKSTVFNRLTGLHQHTGNWTGKTVSSARGSFSTARRRCLLVDVPGAYSLSARSDDERVARDFLLSDEAEAILLVCDAGLLERNLFYALQVLALGKPVLLCLNLMDEAARRGLTLDLPLLSERLGVPVVGVCARKRGSRRVLLDAIDALLDAPRSPAPIPLPAEEEARTAALVREAEALCRGVVQGRQQLPARDRRIDRVLTGKLFAFPVMLLLLALVFYLTIAGANAPSAFLSRLLFSLEAPLAAFLSRLGLPARLNAMLTEGAYRTLSWVVSVMLPPMAIFFPLFTLLEDLGYLPRVAYNLDRPFQRCGACGKQCLTMAMGFGCNAAGVTGCRIIDSKRERLLAVLTNSFVPCNGRFPLLIAVITMFFAPRSTLGASLMLTGVIAVSVLLSFAATALLSATLLRGEPSSFVLELPPYRRPQLGQILVRSLLDRTLKVLLRAALVAAPAGAALWLLANTRAGGESLLLKAASLLDGAGRFLGLDGAILLAFLLGLPANETVLPILLMIYTAGGSLTEPGALADVQAILLQNGWNPRTALCVLLFTLLHWPCSTTLLTVKKETGGWGWTALAAALPTAFGLVLCALIAAL